MMLEYYTFFIWEGMDRSRDLRVWWVSKTDTDLSVHSRPHGPFEDVDAAKRYLRKLIPSAVIVLTYRCPEFRKEYGL